MNMGDPEGDNENSELAEYGGYWAESRGLGRYYLSSPSNLDNSKKFSGTHIHSVYKRGMDEIIFKVPSTMVIFILIKFYIYIGAKMSK